MEQYFIYNKLLYLFIFENIFKNLVDSYYNIMYIIINNSFRGYSHNDLISVSVSDSVSDSDSDSGYNRYAVSSVRFFTLGHFSDVITLIGAQF